MSYPFGAGEGCFLPGFEVNCNRSIPYLAQSNFRLLEILQGEVRIKSNPLLAATNASNRSNWTKSLIQLPEQSPYTVSVNLNHFVAVGCGTWGFLMSGNGVITTSCVSKCKDKVDNGSCTGNGCCEASMPRSGKLLNMNIVEYYHDDNSKSFSPVGYGFVVEIGRYNFTASDLRDMDKSKNISMKLDWAIGEGDCSQVAESESYKCGKNSSCVDSERGYGYLCECSPGYEGNPYLNGSEGCQVSFLWYRGSLVSAQKEAKDASFSGIIAGTGFIGLCFSCWLSIKKTHLIKLRAICFHNNGGTRLLQHFCETEGTTTRQVKIFSADELKKATNNYSSKQLLSKDDRDKVYKGTLHDGSISSLTSSSYCPKSTTVMLLKFLGCCLETQVPMLVYEFTNLSWKHTLQISRELADAISFLHSFPSGPILHNHINSSAVLLREHSLVSGKPEEFQMSKLILLPEREVSTTEKGNLGYLDPEYFQTGIQSTKSDVYSFGVLLLELLLCQKPVQHGMSRDYSTMVLQFSSFVERQKLFEAFDKFATSRGSSSEQLQAMARITRNCLNIKGEQRPTMDSVVDELASLPR
ncbi:wall-associated receptor kinase 2-like [Aristolochia californica]|uniref:wall-associated receptor kinase 2-like n=1 Tax=Aristolochia californica TaxID=171875 RepID=UPI0035E0D76C